MKKRANRTGKLFRLLGLILALALVFSCKSSLTKKEDKLDSISISASYSIVPKGIQVQYTATAVYTVSADANVTEQASWSVSDTQLAKIVNVAGGDHLRGTLFPLQPGTVTISSTYQGVTGTTTLEITDAALSSIEVSPYQPSLALSLTPEVQFSATGVYSDGLTVDLTPYVTWSSSAVSVALIGNAYEDAGRATSVSAGTTEITASFNQISGTSSLTFNSDTLSSLGLTPSFSDVAAQSAVRFKAMGILASGKKQDLTESSLWSSATPATATVSNFRGYRGEVTGLAAGTSVLSAALGATSGSATVKVGTQSLSSIAIEPALSALQVGSTFYLKGVGIYFDGVSSYTHQEITSSLSWTSSDSTIATVCNAAPCQGAVTAVAPGTVVITAAGANTLKTISLTLTVLPTTAQLVDLSVTPNDRKLTTGSVQQLRAYGTYLDGTARYKLEVTERVEWSSSDKTILHVSNQGGHKGKLTYLGAGAVSIQAISQGVSAKSNFTVSSSGYSLTSLTVDTPSSLMSEKGLMPLKAIGIYSNGSDSYAVDMTPAVNWSSSSAATARVSNAVGREGLVTGVLAGTSTMTATSGTVTGTATVTVKSAASYAYNNLFLTPLVSTLPVGVTLRFQAQGEFINGTTYSHEDLTQEATWFSSNPAVIRISNQPGSQGVAQTLGAGSATLTASWKDNASVTKTASLAVTVDASSLSKIHLTPQYDRLSAGFQLPLHALGEFKTSGGLLWGVDLTSSVAWSNLNPALERTDVPVENGMAEAGLAVYRKAASAASITASLGTAQGTTTLNADGATLSSIQVTPTNFNLTVGSRGHFKALGTFSDGTIRDITDSVLWTASSTAAKVLHGKGQKGVVEALAVSSSLQVQARHGAVLSASGGVVAIKAPTLSSIEITPAAGTFPLALSHPLHAVGVYSDGTVQDLTEVVTWSTTAPTVGVVSNQEGEQGLLYPLAAGTMPVRADWGGVQGSVSLTLESRNLSGLSINPQNASLAELRRLQLNATGTFTSAGGMISSLKVNEAVIWSSSAPEVASVSNRPGEKGLVSGRAKGRATITAQWGNQSVSTLVVVW